MEDVMKVLVFGSINIDLIYTVDHIVRGGETIASTSLTRSAGGKGANQAAALAKAGLPVFFAGKMGEDGAFLAELLESFGVDTRRLIRAEGPTGQALIQLDKNRQNAILLFAGGNGQIGAEEVDAALEGFGADDIVVLQNEINLTGRIMERAKARGLRVALNPSPYDERIEGFPLETVDMFFVNEIEGALLVKRPLDNPRAEILEALATRFPACEIILTGGREGAWYAYKDIREHSGIVDTPVVDTTGAGDTFLGFFIAARARGRAPAEALAVACKASSIAVSRLGAMASIPLANEVF
jgi:ribokinase